MILLLEAQHLVLKPAAPAGQLEVFTVQALDSPLAKAALTGITAMAVKRLMSR